MPCYHITHRTEYNYTDLVSLCQNEARLFPRDTAFQKLAKITWTIKPSPVMTVERTDFFGNRVIYFSIEEPHDHLIVEIKSKVEVKVRPKIELSTSLPWEQAKELFKQSKKPEAIDAHQFVLPSFYCPCDDALAAFAQDFFTPQKPFLQAVNDFTLHIYQTFQYDSGFTTIMTPVSEVLAHRRGVCQDFTHLAIAALRSLGIPARYVSGYLETQPPPGKEKLQGADASHAWFAVYDMQLGWVEFDPTNGKLADETHIVTAWGRDYQDVSPLKGVLTGGGTHDIKVTVDVIRQTH